MMVAPGEAHRGTLCSKSQKRNTFLPTRPHFILCTDGHASFWADKSKQETEEVHGPAHNTFSRGPGSWCPGRRPNPLAQEPSPLLLPAFTWETALGPLSCARGPTPTLGTSTRVRKGLMAGKEFDGYRGAVGTEQRSHGLPCIRHNS